LPKNYNKLSTCNGIIIKAPRVVLDRFEVRDFEPSGVDDIDDVFDGDRRFGNVRRQDHFSDAATRSLKSYLLQIRKKQNKLSTFVKSFVCQVFAITLTNN
jgi:hypothetical protein